ncbi:hypothetical protein DPMN_131499, partial [Dreissena polymorpha]
MAEQLQNKLNEDQCRRALNRAHKKIVTEMDPDVILVALKKCGFLKQEEYDDLMNLLTIPMKCRLLISKISQSGEKAYYVFKKCLSDTKHDSLVKELEEKEKELIIESSRYKSLTDERLRTQKIEEIRRASSQGTGISVDVNVDRTPSDKQLVDLASTIGNGWEMLAAYLDISSASLDQIKADNSRHVERVYQMFLLWRRRKTNSATLRMLLKNMKECEAVVVDWEGVRERLGFGLEVIDTLNDVALKRIQAVLGAPHLSIQPQLQTPALQESAFNVLRRDTVITTTIQKDLHDGRLIELSKEMVEELRSQAVSDPKDIMSGAFGRVHVSREAVPGFNLRVVLKEINLEQQPGNQTTKLASITNEKIAARLMHFGIVPLLAYYDDHKNQKYYFVSPYFENGDLFEAVKEDTDRLKRRFDVKMAWKTRFKIMYQIACAIDFMHTGNKFRGTILHMDIKSKNIVLDAKFNARLIDFGLARELKEGDETLLMTVMPVGTPGYFPTVQHCLLKKQHDYHNFGVVLLELITGLDPSANEEGIELRRWHKHLAVRKAQTSIWTLPEIVEETVCIAIRCIESVKDDGAEKNLSSNAIVSLLMPICRMNSVPKWETSDGGRCDICLVNNTLTVGFDVHCCFRPIHTCCSCMRNSYINPVKCHTCGETIEPFINDKWGAILVAGYDEDAGKVFLDEINTFKKVITSKVVPAMCISSDNVIVIEPIRTDPMTDTDNIKTFECRINEAFAQLMKKNIRTLLFVYSGHKDESTNLRQEGHIQVGPQGYYSLKKFSETLNASNLEKVIAVLDCCFSEKLDLKGSLKLIQFNATSPNDAASANTKEGSPFLKCIIQALTGRANGDKCRNETCECLELLSKDFITLEDLWKYLNIHLKVDRPHMNTKDIQLSDTILAYNYQFEVKFEFKLHFPGIIEHSTSIHVRPREFNEFEQLKLILATEVMKNLYVLDPYNNCNVSKEVADILSIEIHTGPKAKHIQEIDSVEKLLSAWNSKRLLRCTIRPLQNMGVGKPVGKCLRNVPNIRDVHQAVLQKCNIM